jgi:hypothetical protein
MHMKDLIEGKGPNKIEWVSMSAPFDGMVTMRGIVMTLRLFNVFP